MVRCALCEEGKQNRGLCFFFKCDHLLNGLKIPNARHFFLEEINVSYLSVLPADYILSFFRL